MSLENLVSIKIVDSDLEKINQAVTALNETLKPLLISLTAQQRREVPKMGDSTAPFVSKALEYAQSNPEFAPPYMDVPEMEIDMKAVEKLTNIYRSLTQLTRQLDDSILLSGSEAYVSALAFYNSVKIATRMNIPNAKAIHEDLKKRFASLGRSSEKAEELEQEA